MAVVNSMSTQTRGEPPTAYLVFKLALRSSDRELASQCLESLSTSQDHNEYLSACIAESQHTGDVISAIDGLKRLVSKYEYQAPNPVNLPALLRSVIRLLYSILDKPVDNDGQKTVVIQDLCNMFETGTTPTSRPTLQS